MFRQSTAREGIPAVLGEQSRMNADVRDRTRVSIVTCADYTPSSVLKAVKEAVDLLGGMEHFVQPGESVLLKPNLLSPRPPESAVCTHPAVVEAVAGLTTAAGGKCALGDSPSLSGETPDSFRELIRTTGMLDAIERTGIDLLRFDDSGVEREIPDALVFRRILLSSALQGAEVLINLPKFKTHELTLLTGAVKNLFGCVPGRRKIEFHLQAGADPVMFSQMLVDLLRAVRPSLNIMDGIVGMDGQGPSAGRRRTFGVILASTDPVALDAVACMVAGVEPMIIPALRLASEQGVGIADPVMIEVIGASVEEVRIPDFLLPPRGDALSRVPSPVYRMARNQLVRTPAFLTAKCTSCGTCVEVCPVRAITEHNGRLRVDRGKCIRCYCCQEVCPEEAIVLRSGRLRGIVEAAIEIRRALKRLLKQDAPSE